MAIYHLSAKTASKGKGQSASAMRAYRERDGRYSNQADPLVYSESGNLPGWADDSAHFWESVDTYERSNGRVCVEYECSLPRELDWRERVQLAKEYAEEITGGQLPYTFAIHRGDNKETGEVGQNPHVHIMVNERVSDGIERSPEQHFKRANGKDPERGGAKKENLYKREILEQNRSLWAQAQNRHLEQRGHAARVDHRSYKERNIGKAPTKHVGPKAYDRFRRTGKKTKRMENNDKIGRLNRSYRKVNRDYRDAQERQQEKREKLDRLRGKRDKIEKTKAEKPEKPRQRGTDRALKAADQAMKTTRQPTWKTGEQGAWPDEPGGP